MATYGEPGKNEFTLTNINGKYSIVVNPETKISQIYQRKSQFDFQSIGTLDIANNRLTFDENAPLTTENKSALSKNITTFRRQSVAVATVGGATNAEELLLGNSQPPPPNNAPGQSDDDTSNGGLPKSPATFGITTNEFQKKKGEEYNNNYLTYPKNISDYQDRITIVQRQYVSPDVLTNKNFDVSKVDNFGKERFYDDRFIKNLGTVTLPMPNDISETNVTAWGEDNLSSLAALVGGTALGVAKGVSEFDTEKIQNAIKDAAGEIFNGPGGETIKQLLALNAAAQISQKFGININPEAFRSRITGTAINQNLELLFQGPKLRSFGFQFKMTPRSEDEAKNIRNILKFFKKGMAPKRTTTDSTGSYFLGAPNVFDIHFKSGKGNEDLKSIGKIKTCALQQCVVNYTPDGFYAAFADKNAGGSQPIAVTMQLAFTELTPIYNEYFDLTNEDSVGFDENTLTSYV